jgi:hypothetical protein
MDPVGETPNSRSSRLISLPDSCESSRAMSSASCGRSTSLPPARGAHSRARLRHDQTIPVALRLRHALHLPDLEPLEDAGLLSKQKLLAGALPGISA